MYKETDGYGQYQLDCRLSSEKSLEENTNLMISFACDVLKNKRTRTKNCHEGYGVLAEDMQNVNANVKAMQNGMKDYLASLPSDAAAIDAAESIANALADTIVSALTMAAEAKRISKDLYAATDFRTPIEQALDQDGFSEPVKEE